jgi:hypothetical protein
MPIVASRLSPSQLAWLAAAVFVVSAGYGALMPLLPALSGVVMLVLSAFELGIEVALMFAQCSLVMLGVNALLFFTALLDKVSGRALMGAGLVLAAAGLGLLAQHRTAAAMYLGISLTAAGTGLVLPVLSYLAAGALAGPAWRTAPAASMPAPERRS